MATVSDRVQNIYIGLLGRAADQDGLDYWTAEIDLGILTYEQLRANIVNEQPEYQQGLGQLSRPALVNALYQNLFDRSAESTGLDYWVSGDGAGINADQMVLALINGAQGDDVATLENRAEVATYYTTQAGDGYAQADASAAIAGIDHASDLAAAKADIDATLNAGETLTLTSGIDIRTGSPGNDTFVAALEDSSGTTTYNTGDELDGGNGRDTLRIVAADDQNEANNITTTSIEVVDIRNFSSSTLTLDASQWSGVDEFVATGDDDIEVDHLGDAFSTITYRNFTEKDNFEVEVDDTVFAGSGDEVVVNLENAGSIDSGDYVDLYLDNASGDDVLEQMVVNSITSNAGGNYLWFNDADVLDTITVTGSTDLELERSGSDRVTSVDASGMSAGLQWSEELEASAGDFTYVGASGRDQVEVEGQAGSANVVTLALGDGDDDLMLDSQGGGGFAGASVTLGAGSDSVTLDDFENLTGTSNSDLDDDLLSFEDFDGAADTLDLSVPATRAGLTNAEKAAVGSAADLADAVATATGAADWSDGDWVAFEFEGSTYVYADTTGTNGLSTDDGLAELVGFTGTLDSSNFIGA